MDSKRAAPVGVGVVTIFTVLLVLTLSVFAALTLTTARADLALSRTNAETVAAWYAADALAAEHYAAFAASGQAELEELLPVAGRQSLHLHLVRRSDGTVDILAWQTVSTAGGAEDTLPVWDGALPEE